MGKVDLSHLSEEECQLILQVIQRDYDIRQREKERICKQKELLDEEETKTEILSKHQQFNQNNCIRCCSQFGFFFNRKRVCFICKFNVCRQCSVYDNTDRQYLCNACWQQRETALQSCDWFYTGIKRRFRKFGSAKVVKTLYKRQNELESETESVCTDRSDKKRSDIIGLFQQSKHLWCDADETSRLETGSERSSVGRVSNRTCGTSETLGDPYLNAPLKRFDDSLDTIIRDLHTLIRADEQLLNSEVIDPEHPRLAESKEQIYAELISLSDQISDAMNSDSEDEMDDDAQYSLHVRTRVRRYLVQKVEHITKTRLNHLLPQEDDQTDNWGCCREDKRYLEEQLALVVLKKVLEDYNKTYDITDGRDFTSPLPLCEQTIEEGSSDDSDETINTDRQRHLQSPIRTSSFKVPEMSSGSDFFDSDMTIPSFNSDREKPRPNVNRQMMSLMKTASPLPSFDHTPSPIGRLEMDLDDLSSLQKFVYYSDEEQDSDPTDSNRPETFLLKAKDHPEMKVWSPSRDHSRSLQQAINVVVPQFDERISPMVGNRNADELSDLSSPSETESDVGDLDKDSYAASTTSSDDDQRPPSRLDWTISARDQEICSETDTIEPLSAEYQVLLEPNLLTLNEDPGVLPLNNHYMLSNGESLDPKFVSVTTTVSGSRGEAITLSCQVAGTHPIDVFWYRENNVECALEEGEKYETRRDVDICALTIYSTDWQDAGLYMCIAVNDIGQSSQTIQLSVTDNNMEFKEPEFLKRLADVALLEGQTAKFNVKVKGYPLPRVVWHKDGVVLRNSDEYVIEKFGNRGSTLSIYCVSMEDDAEYTAVACNIAGRVTCSAQLLVEEKPKEKQVEPTRKNKTATNMENLSRKLSQTRDDVTQTAEDVLGSAEKLSSLNRDLDHVNKSLQRMEKSVSPTIKMSHLEQERVIYNDRKQRELARQLKKTTESSLEIITKTERVIASEKHNGTATPCKNKNTTLIPTEKMNATESTKVELNKAKISRIDKSENGKIKAQQKPAAKSKLNDTSLLITPNQSVRPSKVALEPARKKTVPNEPARVGDVSRQTTWLSDGYHRRPTRLNELPSQQTVWPSHVLPATLSEYRPVDTVERFSRDYDTGKSNQKKWDVKMPTTRALTNVTTVSPRTTAGLDVTEENIYMTASKVTSLQQKVNKLDKKMHNIGSYASQREVNALEEAISRTVAQVSSSEKEVSKIERDVHKLQKMMSSDSLLQLSITSEDSGIGTGSPSTPTDHVCLSGYDLDREKPKPGSVNKLRTMFDILPSKSGNFFRPPRSSAHQNYMVHSITGRDRVRMAQQREDELKKQKQPVLLRKSLATSSTDNSVPSAMAEMAEGARLSARAAVPPKLVGTTPPPQVVPTVSAKTSSARSHALSNGIPSTSQNEATGFKNSSSNGHLSLNVVNDNVNTTGKLVSQPRTSTPTRQPRDYFFNDDVTNLTDDDNIQTSHF